MSEGQNDSLSSNDLDVELFVYDELKRLRDLIKSTTSEVANIQQSLMHSDMAEAQDQLDAIVNSTAEATHRVMEAAEKIELMTKNLENAEEIKSEITHIYESCSFQDLVGQRVSKVMKTIHSVESVIEEILNTIQPGSATERKKVEINHTAPRSDEHLMNGPQLPGQGTSQEEADRILKAKENQI